MGGDRSTLEVSIAIIPKVGGMISLIACTFIMRDVSIKWAGKKYVPLTSVIIFFISIADWLYSLFAAFMSTWMVPVDSGAYLASGNTQSCSAQGFIAAFARGASMSYYAVLMILYWLIVHYGWSENRLSKWGVRLSLILPPFIIAFGIAIPPLVLGFYNYSGLYSCSIHPYPLECEHDPDVECTRGAGAWIYWDAFWVYAMMCNIIIIIFVSLLTYRVFKQESKTDKYLLQGQSKRRENTIKTAWQGIRYIIAFLLAYISLYIFTGFRLSNRFPPTAVIYLNLILPPLSGFFNSCAYFRPRYIAYKEKNPDAPRLIRLGNAVFNIDFDYLESRRAGLSSFMRSTVGPEGGSRGNDSSEGDLASPLFRAESTDEPAVV